MTPSLLNHPDVAPGITDEQGGPPASADPFLPQRAMHAAAIGANVLLVDRHAATRKLLGNFLQRIGYQVWRAANVQEAHTLLAMRRIDLVALDVLLPDGKGPEFIRTLRGDDNTAERPIVIISSLASTRNVCAGLACGADDYIAKPVTLGVVAARFGAVLRRYGWNSG